LHTVSIGVPVDIAVPPLLSKPKYDACLARFGVILPVPIQAADLVALLVRQSSTNSTYDTHGGVSADEKLVTMATKWTTRNDYKRKLKAIARRFHCELADVITCDQSFRTKRSMCFVFAFRFLFLFFFVLLIL
jgi:hypothetical protein